MMYTNSLPYCRPAHGTIVRPNLKNSKIETNLREQVESEIDRWNDEGGNIPFSGHNDNRN